MAGGIIPVFSQQTGILDSSRAEKANCPADSVRLNRVLHFHQEFDYSLAASSLFLVNWQQDHNSNNIILSENLKYQVSLEYNPTIRFSNMFIHNLGFQYYFDSLCKITNDDNALNTRLELIIRRRLSITVISSLSTRFINGYDYLTGDSGKVVRMLNSSFLTPLQWNFSTGLGYALPSYGSVTFGIAGGKLTYLMNTKIFTIRKTDNFYGVPVGKCLLLEYGLTFQILIDKALLSRLRWNCDLLLFKNYRSSVDLTLKNLFSLKLGKYFKTSLQTRILYEEKYSKKLQFENLLSVGVNFHL